MSNINPIEKEIRALRDRSAENLFEVLMPFASNFRQLEIELGLIPEYNWFGPVK